MARELLIYRHGKADVTTGAGDFEHELKDRGKRDAQRIGAWLWQKDLRPDCIRSSAAVCAKVSAQKLCKAMGADTGMIVEDPFIYAADLNTLLARLADCPNNSQRVMLVGHKPGVTDLLLYLLGGKAPLPVDGKLMPTSALARLKMPDQWQRLDYGSARLQSLTRPSELPKKFPWPAPDGDQWRDRPAYYYRQSAVIPYRLKNDELQLLLIGSSKRNHWVVPKGIHEPGLSAQESAAREACEEAGIMGRVGDDSLGSYSYQKWGAECVVQVYPMRVDMQLPEDEWDESHRGRKWLSIERAGELIRQQEMRPMIDSLAARISAGD